MNVTIIAPFGDCRLETFIRAHVERLPAHVDFLYGGTRPLVPKTSQEGPLLDGVGPLACVLRLLDRVRYRGRWERAAESATTRALSARLKRTKCDVVLAEYGPTATCVMDACDKAGVPLVAHFHGYDAYDLALLRAESDRYRLLFSRAAAVVAVSQHMRGQLLDLGAREDRLHLNPYGVDVQAFTPVHAGQNPPRFLAVGRLVEKKAPYLTLLAFSRVLDRHPDAQLVFIGDGPLMDVCRKLAGALGASDNVQFHGAVGHEVVATEMRRARAFVQHSLRAGSGDSEGTPVSILEAGAVGLPVVSTRHAGIQDAVLEHRTGILVDEGDVGGMTSAMVSLIEDPELADRLGKAAQKRIETAYAMDTSLEKLACILESTVKERGA